MRASSVKRSSWFVINKLQSLGDENGGVASGKETKLDDLHGRYIALRNLCNPFQPTMKYASIFVALVALFGAEAFSPREYLNSSFCLFDTLTGSMTHTYPVLIGSTYFVRSSQGCQQAFDWPEEGRWKCFCCIHNWVICPQLSYRQRCGDTTFHFLIQQYCSRKGRAPGSLQRLRGRHRPRAWRCSVYI